MEEIKNETVENLDEYELQKIKYTLSDVKHGYELIENYLKMVSYCDDNGTVLRGLVDLSKLRYSNGLVGPNGVLNKLMAVFMNAQTVVGKQLTMDQAANISFLKSEKFENIFTETNVGILKNLDTNEPFRKENLSDYEKEKITYTLKDFQLLSKLIENYLIMISYCDDNGIVLDNLVDLSKLRYPNGLVGPDSDLHKINAKIISAHTVLAEQITEKQLNSIFY